MFYNVAVIIFRKCNMISNLYVDVMSLLKQVITTIFYSIMIKIEFIIMSERYYVSCHVKVLNAAMKETSYYYISYYKLPPLSQDLHGVAIALLSCSDHQADVDNFYYDIVNTVHGCIRKCIPIKKRNELAIVGWNDEVKHYHRIARS